MSKSKIVTFIIRRVSNQKYICPWPDYVPRTAKNLEHIRQLFNASLEPGGANEHLDPSAAINYAIEIYNQKTGDVICKVNPPIFEVVK